MRTIFAAWAFWMAATSPAAAQTGTWDVTGRAVARASYEGQQFVFEYAIASVLTLGEDGRYRVADSSVSCLPPGAAIPESRGTWRLTRANRLRGPFNAAGVKSTLAACFGDTAS